MGDFLKEPWAFILIFAIVANILWAITWLSMWSKDRFKKSFGGGLPILLSIGILNVPFGFLFLAGAVLGTAVLSVFWLYASLTNSFENERKAILEFMNPREETKNEEGGAQKEETAKPAAKMARRKSP